MRSNREIIDKIWALYISRLLQARKDLRYAFNRRHENGNVDWKASISARIGDIQMWEAIIQATGIGWDKYNLANPIDIVNDYDNGKE